MTILSSHLDALFYFSILFSMESGGLISLFFAYSKPISQRECTKAHAHACISAPFLLIFLIYGRREAQLSPTIIRWRGFGAVSTDHPQSQHTTERTKAVTHTIRLAFNNPLGSFVSSSTRLLVSGAEAIQKGQRRRTQRMNTSGNYLSYYNVLCMYPWNSGLGSGFRITGSNRFSIAI